MDILSPGWIWLGLLALPILALYMLKLRRREVQVSSILLWEKLLADRQANAPWQRIKRNLLLFMQLLVLAALVFSLARPSIRIPAAASGSVVVLLDASASMNADDIKPSRFEAARKEALNLVNGLESGARMTIILAGMRPQVLASGESDQATLRRVLGNETTGPKPTMESADWSAAFALAASAITGGQATASTIVIISDGGLPASGLPRLPGEVRYIPVGTSGENLAISALAMRQDGGSNQLFARVTNYGLQDHSAILSFYSDDQLFKSQQIELPAGKSSSVTLVNLPGSARIYKAQLSNSGGTTERLDAFSPDDTAFTVSPARAGGRTLLVSQGNLFLEQILASVPGITPFRLAPAKDGKFEIPRDPFNLYVFDGTLPASLPAGNLLLINPPPNPLFEVTGVFSNTQGAQISNSPLTRSVDWDNVHVQEARQVKTPAWANLLVNSEGGPLVFAGETGGRRVAAVTFDLHHSDLPLQIAFPILFANLLNYLAPGQPFEAPAGLQPGDSLAIGLPQTSTVQEPSQIVIASPAGKIYTYPATENGVRFTSTGELGVYAVNFVGNQPTGALPAGGYFAVNLFDESESNIHPASMIQIGQKPVQASTRKETGRREIWPWLVTTGLVLLMAEWWVYQRGSTLARGKAFFHSGG